MTLLLSVVSCASITEIDEPLCYELSIKEGRCTTIISGKSFYIDDNHPYKGKTWFDMRQSMILMPVETWVKLKAYITKMCVKYNQCEEANQATHRIDELFSGSY